MKLISKPSDESVLAAVDTICAWAENLTPETNTELHIHQSEVTITVRNIRKELKEDG